MKKTFITLLVTILLGSICSGETLILEVVEFDCSAHPDLFEKYCNAMRPNTDAKMAEFSLNDAFLARKNVLSKIEQVAEKTLFLKLSQEFLIGENINLVTQLQDYKFELKASTEDWDDGLINVSLDFSLSKGEYNKKSITTEVIVSHGQTIPMGNGAETQTVQSNDGVTKKTKVVSMMRFTIK